MDFHEEILGLRYAGVSPQDSESVRGTGRGESVWEVDELLFSAGGFSGCWGGTDD